MSNFVLLCLAFGLSMDAFSVAVCKGLATPRLQARHYLAVGLWFGGFQALMPALGFFLAGSVEQYVQAYAPYIAFGLLGILGVNMIRSSKQEEQGDCSFGGKTMFFLAVATSIDAMAVGVTFALVPGLHLAKAIGTIGITTCFCSMAGLKIGHAFGKRFQSKAECLGGIILILIGIKMLF